MAKSKNPRKKPPLESLTPKIELECNLCTNNNAWAGPECKECPLYGKKHYAEGFGDLRRKVDYFCIAEAPDLVGPSGCVDNHATWSTGAEKIIKDAFGTKKLQNFAALNGYYTYAVRCDTNSNPPTRNTAKPPKSAKSCCYPLLVDTLLNNAVKDRPVMVFALGAGVLQTLDIKVKKYAEIQGQFIEKNISGHRVLIYPSLSKTQLLTKSGFIDVLNAHIQQFLRAVHGLKNNVPVQTTTPMEALTREYIYTKTPAEVRDLVSMIIEYADEGEIPKNHAISLDTETNTLNPHREKLKILSLVVGWAKGKAAAIPLEHPETPYSIDDVRPYIQDLLLCSKPKVFHNAKFDLKVLQRKGFTVNRFAWDTMTAEHLLAEDKRGFYNLKALAKLFVPTYAGYAEELKVTKAKKEEESEEKPPEVMENGEPIPPLKGAAKALAEDNGFIDVPLETLNPYSAIDADVTLQLHHLQVERMKTEDANLASRRNAYCQKTSPVFHDIAQTGHNFASPTVNLMFRTVVPLTKTLTNMELQGMNVDVEYVNKLDIDMRRTLFELRTKLHEMIPMGTFNSDNLFNQNSVAHVKQVLFGTGYYDTANNNKIISYNHLVGDARVPHTPKGQISINKDFLKLLALTYKCTFSKTLLEYRAIIKARDTFVNNVLILGAEDSRMHTTFHIPGTATGRLSSSNLNLQNLPKAIGAHNIKKMFIPENVENNVIANIDAKAAEIRIYAAYSKDANLIEALLSGMDPHSFFGSKVYNPETVLAGVPRENYDAVTQLIGIDTKHAWTYEDFQNRDLYKETDKAYAEKLDKLRTSIKRVVFGILYGAGKKKIAETAGIPLEQAQAIIRVLYKMFPTIPNYIDLTEKQVTEFSTVETFMGRRRRFNLDNVPKEVTARAKRQAVNFKIQSTSSDIVLGVLCDLEQPLKELDARLLITVHDSIVLEIPKKHINQLEPLMHEYGVKRVQAKCPWMPVPFLWDITVGPSYGEQQSIPNYLKNSPVVIPEDDYIDTEIREGFIESNDSEIETG